MKRLLLYLLIAFVIFLISLFFVSKAGAQTIIGTAGNITLSSEAKHEILRDTVAVNMIVASHGDMYKMDGVVYEVLGYSIRKYVGVDKDYKRINQNRNLYMEHVEYLGEDKMPVKGNVWISTRKN